MPPAAKVGVLCSPPWAATMAWGCKDARIIPACGACWWGRSNAWEQGRLTQLRPPGRHHPRDSFPLLCADRAQIEQRCWSQLSQGLDQEFHSFKLVPWVPPKPFSEGPARSAQQCVLSVQLHCTHSPSPWPQHRWEDAPGAGTPWAWNSSLGFKAGERELWRTTAVGKVEWFHQGPRAKAPICWILTWLCRGTAWLWDSRGEAVVLWTWLPMQIPPAASAQLTRATV